MFGVESRSTDLKRALAAVHDVIAAAAALLLALALRYGGNLPPIQELAAAIAIFAGLSAVVFHLFGLGRGIWRFASLADLKSIVMASTIIVLTFILFMFLFNRLDYIPRAVPVIVWFIMILLLAAPRIFLRIYKHMRLRLSEIRAGAAAPRWTKLLLIGSATEADHAMRALGLEGSTRYRVVGIVDYSGKSKGRLVRGIRLLGGISEVDGILEELKRKNSFPDALVMTAPRQQENDLRALFKMAGSNGLPVMRIPDPSLLFSEGAEPDLKSVSVDDLLGRPPVRLNFDSIRELLAHKVVLVTGAGGSIGSEIARQVAAYEPSRLVLLDNCEYNIFSIDRQIAESSPDLDRVSLIADIRDQTLVHRLMLRERPDVVFHAAALKHVPLLEANVSEGVQTNIFGTRNVADAAVAAGAKAVVMISTDKAIRPTSVMGATKRAAEAYCQALDLENTSTRFITVRFGNVLGSSGSVVPLFEEQIRRGGPVTITHPDMRRYFMTIREATELVLQAAAHGLGKPGERGRIFVLDMGQPVRILDLARMMISLSGKRPEIDIPIVFTGLRQGEKLFEELFDLAETRATGLDGLMLASPRVLDREILLELIAALDKSLQGGDSSEARRVLQIIVPEYKLAQFDEPARKPMLVPISGSGNAPRAVTS